MNKIYKVVWNTVRNCYVVGSELISSKSGKRSTSNGKSSSLKVTLTVLALCGMMTLGSGVAPAYAADAGAAVESQYVAVLVNDSNNSRRNYRTFDGHSYHKETVSGETYWVRDGYTIKYEENERYPDARKDNIIKAYKTASYTVSSDTGLLKSNQIMVESAGISTLTGVNLDDVSGGTYVGATNSGSTSTPSSFNYMIKDDNGSYIDAGNRNYSTYFAAVTKNSDGTYSYNGEVLSNDNLYVISSNTTSKVGVFLTSSGKVYTGKVFGINNEVLMTTKNDDGTLYSYWGADTPDPNSKLADMTIGQFNQALEKVNNNSKAVAGDAIKKVVTTKATDGNGGTISLLRRGTYNAATGEYEGEHYVDGGLTLTSTGGTGGTGEANNVKIKVSNGTDVLTLDAGTKVEAIGTKDATTGLKINGEDYTIKAGKDYKAGTNVQISDDGTISATDNDTTLKAGKAAKSDNTYTIEDTAGNQVTLEDVASAATVTNNYTTLDKKIDKTKTTITNEYKKYVSDTEDFVTSGSISGDTITLKRALGGEVAITGLKNYVEGLDSYVTSASLKDNKLTITQNNNKGNYEIDLSGFADQFSGTDYRVVANPVKDSGGIYKPDASGNIELTVQDAKTGATSKVQLSDVASAATVNNNYTTLDTKIDKTKTDITNAYTTTINETKNTITNEYKKYVSDTEDYVTSGSISGDTITLKRALGGEVAITGLKDYVEGLDSYVTSASLKDNKLTITQNNGKGNYEVDLSGFADQFSGTDYRVVANPAEGSKGIYKPDASGKIELTVQDAKTGATSKVQLSDVASAATVTQNYNTLNTKVEAAKTTLANGTNTNVESSTAKDGHTEYKVNLKKDVNLGDTIQLNGSNGSISAKSGGAKLSFGNNGLTVSQAKNGLTNETRINGAEITVDGGIGNQTTIKGSMASIGSVLVNGGGGTATISGLTNKTTKYAGFATSGRAATEEQLKEVNSKATAAKTTVTNGKNITVNEAKAGDGSSTYTVGLAKDVVLGDNAIKLNGSDGSISAKSGGARLSFNNNGLTVSQAKNGVTNETRINGAEITVDGGIGNQTTIKGSMARIGSVLVNGGGGTATISGLTNKTTKYAGFATSGRAATEEQLKEVSGQASEAITTANKGWNLTTNGAATSKTNIAPDGTVDFSSSNDNLVISNAGANLSFSLSDNLDLTKNEDMKGSVKVGENTALTDKLLQVGEDVSLTASALNVGTSSLTTSALMVGGLTYINSSGINANGRVISNVAAGTLDTDAVNVGQLKSAISGSKVSIKAGDGITVEKTGNQYTIKTNIKGGSTSTGTVTVTTEDNTSTSSGGSSKLPLRQMAIMETAEMAAAEATTTDAGKAITIANTDFDLKFKTDAGTTATVNNGGTVNISGDDVNVSTSSKAGTNSDTIRIALNKDIKVDSITAKTDGGQLNIKSEVNMNSQKITNLAEGDISETSTDAVTGSQLYNTNQAVIANAENINSLSTSVNKLDSRLNRVGAGAAALAALHPLDFDPDNKWDFAAGYGNYAGANAVAIGTYYRPNENTMFSIGGSFGGGENMVNAGVSFKLGSGSSGITTSKTVMAKKIKEQDELLKAQDAKMKEQDEKIAKLEALVAQQGEMVRQALGKK